MKIKDLLPDHKAIYDRVLECQKEQRNAPNDKLDLTDGLLRGNFNWGATPEGYIFWQQINDKNYQVFYDKYPHLKNSSKDTTKPQFEVGKWYKANKCFYIKYSHTEREISYNRICGETIQTNRIIYRKEDYWPNIWFGKEVLKNGPLTDLSEIQQYLPDGHVDKIVDKPINTYGLKIDDLLEQDIIREWVRQGKNSSYNKKPPVKGVDNFVGDRRTIGFVLIEGQTFFEVSGTYQVYLRAEGFKEFAENFYNKEKQLTSLPEKWKVKITQDNFNFLNKFRLSEGCNELPAYSARRNYYLSNYYVGSINYQYIAKGDLIFKDYIEITTEQFKEWVYDGLIKDIPGIHGKTFEITLSKEDFFKNLSSNSLFVRGTRTDIITSYTVDTNLVGDGFYSKINNDSLFNPKKRRLLDDSIPSTKSII